MEYEHILTILFFLGLLLFIYLRKKDLVIQKVLFPLVYIFLYRTTLGLSSMDRGAEKYNRVLRVLSFIGIIIGFLGMALMCYFLIDNFIKMFISPEAAPAVAPVLPIKAKGVFYVPILYWILSIFFIAIVHEFAHGLIARVYKIPVKSSGFAFICLLIPIIPAAFVEPDEKKLRKKPIMEQLGVFAAGPFANVIFGFLCFGILAYVLAPAGSAMIYDNGVEITTLTEGLPAMNASMQVGEVITFIEDRRIDNLSVFMGVLSEYKPGEEITIQTREKDISENTHSYPLTLTTHPDNDSKPYVGVHVQTVRDIKPEIASSLGKAAPKFYLWVIGLFFWLYVLNLGIGLFNLLPAGPLDGGRMVHLVLEKYFAKETAKQIFKYLSLGLFGIILVLLLWSFIR